MPALVSRWLPLAALILAAFWLRTHDLAQRPMHSDEANQAVKLGELIEHGDYAIDPRDHHGPTLYYAAVPIAWARGQHTLAALDETTVRLVPAIAGTLSVLLLAGIAAPFGAWPALAAAALLALSPPAVYYSRDFIQETLLVTFLLGFIAAGTQWWRTGRSGWAIVAGVCAGLLFATKASAPLFLVATALAALAARPPRPASTRLRRDALLAAAAALLVALALVSSLGTHPAGVRDALAAYGFGANRAASGSGHEKPWWYYVSLFGLRQTGGLTWEQLGFSALALSGAGLLAWRQPAGQPAWTGRRLLVGALVYTLVIAAVLSALPYKTPWHAVHFVPGLCVLAAGALASLPRRTVAWVLAGLVLVMQAKQVRLAVFQRPADARNPYAYVHSSPDVLKVRALAVAAQARHPGAPIRVIGDEYWPLPWYLRGLPGVGYWNTAPDDCDGALVIASGSPVDTVRRRLHGSYRESILGLRPDVLCIVFTRP